MQRGSAHKTSRLGWLHALGRVLLLQHVPIETGGAVFAAHQVVVGDTREEVVAACRQIESVRKFRALELDSNDLVMMAADVETTPAVRVGTPKVLFRLAGPVNSSLGGVSRDGQRFVLPINVPVPPDKTAQPSGAK